ncbi:hypothetical protein [Humibacter ginsenosidimutans]|uniref:hypothetical protein n=1 Tax=Humibacter ginsenosidimutans TaxID=2599293 RepID=UPI001FEF94AE|nr:hypothetical protein [Humibacter ginsenosidimutans]
MTSTLSLAERLSGLDDTALHDLVRARGLARARIEDFFDLADALLEPPSVQHALAPLPRPVLAALAAVAQAAGDTAEPVDAERVSSVLHDWGSVDASPTALRDALHALVTSFLAEPVDGGIALYPGVAARFGSWAESAGTTGAKLAASGKPAALATVPDVDPRFVNRLAAERAFVAAGTVAEFVYELEREPARELQKGGLALPDTRRIASALGIEPASVPIVHWLARQCGLVVREGSLWLPTDTADEWTDLSTPERWARLATAWLGSVPADIRPLMVERAHASWGRRCVATHAGGIRRPTHRSVVWSMRSRRTPNSWASRRARRRARRA